MILLYTYINGRNLATNERIGNETQILTNQIWRGRVEDLQEKSGMYVDIITRDNAQNMKLCDELYRREQDVQERQICSRDLTHVLVEVREEGSCNCCCFTSNVRT